MRSFKLKISYANFFCIQAEDFFFQVKNIFLYDKGGITCLSAFAQSGEKLHRQ